MRNTTYALAYLQRCVRQRLRSYLIILGVVIALTGCTAVPGDNLPTANTVQPTPTGTILAFTTIDKGGHLSTNPYLDTAKVIIIASGEESNIALQQVIGEPPKLNEVPHTLYRLRDIDYDRFFVALVLQGKQCCTGYEVTVQQVMRNQNELSIHATFTTPAPGQAVSPTLTHPYHAISIEKGDMRGQKIHINLVVDGKVVAEMDQIIR